MKKNKRKISYSLAVYLPVLLLLAISSFAQQNRELSPQMNLLAKPGSSPDWIDFRDDAELNPSTLFVDYSTYFKLGSGDEMRVTKILNDDLGYAHYRYQQYAYGYKVEGGEFMVHVNNSNHTYCANGKMVIGLITPAKPAFSAQQAQQFAMNAMGASTYKWESEYWENEIKVRTGNKDTSYAPVPQLVWYNGPAMKDWNAAAFRLVWTMDLYAASPDKSARYFIDANTGENITAVALESNCNAATVSTIFNGNRTIYTQSISVPPFNFYYMKDDCQTATWRVRDWGSSTSTSNPQEITNLTNTWTTTNEIFGGSVNWEIRRAYSYFSSVHGRASYDNANGSIEAYVNAVFKDANGNDYVDNASMSFTGGTMKVGLGSSGTLANSWSCLDIIAHEYTHAVTGSSAALTYSYESGALNESFSDIFGEVIENYVTGTNDWLMGDQRTSGYIRSMANPNLKNDPDTYLGTNWYTGTGDAGGVHTNSGVQNYWFYLLTAGGSGTNDNGQTFSVSGIGLTAARAIAYRNLTFYLGSGSQYIDAREGAIRSAIDLYGSCSNQAIQTGKAWYACGVGNSLPEFNYVITCGSTNIGGTATGINSIVTSFNCSTGANPSFTDVVYRAGNYIVLQQGFVGQYNGTRTFTAMIDPCSYTAYRLPSTQDHDPEEPAVNEETKTPVSSELSLKAWPNPCRDECELSFILNGENQVAIHLYNQTGQMITVIQEANNMPEGIHRYHLDTKGLAPGVYQIIAEIGGKKLIQKIVKNE